MAMKINDWAYCEKLDTTFKILAVKDYLLQESEMLWIHKKGCVRVDTQECSYCHEQKPDIEERYSFTVYAGKMCDDCAYSRYRDHCGLDGAQGDPNDLDEPLEPEE